MPSTAGSVVGSRRVTRWAATHPALAVVTGYVLLRLTDLVAFAVVGGSDGRSLGETITSWDGGWFTRAAVEGWPDRVVVMDGARSAGTTWAWPPLFPLAGRLVALPFGADAVPFALAGVAVLCGLLAALVLSRTVRPFIGSGAGVAVGLLWASLPASPVLGMSYSEGLFCLLAFTAVWAATRERWVLAGVVLLAAGLVRTSTLPFAVALVVVAWVAWRRPVRGATTASLVVVTVFAGMSVAAWPLAVALRAGRWDGLSQVQAAWGRSTLPFHDTLGWVKTLSLQGWPEVGLTVVMVAAAAVAAVWCWRDRRYPLVLRLIGPMSVVFLLMTGVGYSGVRLLLADVALPIWLQSLLRNAAAVVAGCLLLLALRWIWIGVYVGGSPDTPPP